MPRFRVFIDGRRLPSFKPRPGLHRWPVFGTIGCSFDCWCKGTKIFGIYQIFACDKERFSAKHLRFETSLKNGLCFLWGASLCFCGIENYVLRYESAYKKCLREEWGKFTGNQLLSSFWLKVARTDEDRNTTRWDRGTLPIRNLYPKWGMLRFGRIRKVTN